MSRYYTDGNRPTIKTQAVGTEKEPIYKERVDKSTGKTILKIVGETNVLERAQADLDSCNISKLMEKYGVTQVDSVRQLFKQFDVEFEDTETFNGDHFDVLNKVTQLKEDFKGADSSIKSYYGDDFNRFYKAVQDRTVLSDLEKINSQAVAGLKKSTQDLTESITQTQGGETNAE